MAYTLQWNGEVLQAALQRGMVKAVDRAAKYAAVAVKKVLNQRASNRSNPRGAASPPGQPPAKMTGKLGQAITSTMPVVNSTRVSAEVGVMNGLRYARIHEFGGTIVAKGKKLAIPLSREAKRASQQGVGPQQALAGKGSFVLATGKAAYIVTVKGVRGKGGLVFHYMLRHSVKMPKRPYLFPTIAAERERIGEIMRQDIRQEIGKALQDAQHASAAKLEGRMRK